MKQQPSSKRPEAINSQLSTKPCKHSTSPNKSNKVQHVQQANKHVDGTASDQRQSTKPCKHSTSPNKSQQVQQGTTSAASQQTYGWTTFCFNIIHRYHRNPLAILVSLISIIIFITKKAASWQHGAMKQLTTPTTKPAKNQDNHTIRYKLASHTCRNEWPNKQHVREFYSLCLLIPLFFLKQTFMLSSR